MKKIYELIPGMTPAIRAAYPGLPGSHHLTTSAAGGTSSRSAREADEQADFRDFVRLSKQRSGWRYKRRTGSPLWQEGYCDRVLRKDEDSWAVARYIIENPIRARLVDRVEDYPFWGSGTYSRDALIDYMYSRT